MKLTILGIEHECRHLSPANRLRWNLYLHTVCLGSFYSDLHATIEHLPTVVQVAIIRQHSPPARLDASMPLYYKLATTPAAVRYFLELVVDGEPPEVTRDNASEIFLAVKQLIAAAPPPMVTDTEEKQDAALKEFETLEGS